MFEKRTYILDAKKFKRIVDFIVNIKQRKQKKVLNHKSLDSVPEKKPCSTRLVLVEESASEKSD